MASETPDGLTSSARRELDGWKNRECLSARAVAEQLRVLGVRRGDILLLHVSFRAARPIQGGPARLLAGARAAVGPTGTLVMPSYTGDDDSPFDPRQTPADPDLGIVAEIFRRLPETLRSDHPFAFAAWGRHAAAITADPIAFPPHCTRSPVGRVLELGGRVLLVGVGHDASTTIHLAKFLAGVPYCVPKHCTVRESGRAKRIDYWEIDHCCERFGLADEWLRDKGLQAEGPVGHAHSRLADASDVVSAVTRELAANPTVFLHPEAEGCRECDEARRGMAHPSEGSSREPGWPRRKQLETLGEAVCVKVRAKRGSD